MRLLATACLSAIFLTPLPGRAIQAVNTTLAASRQGRAAIEVLLAAYTQAVSTKDQSLFESLLLSKTIPFTYVSEDKSRVARGGTANYEAFRKAVLGGRQFKQIFKNVTIEQDGNLANVRLIFVNTDATSTSWGWKTLQLLKVNGAWKIASEFYTVH